MPNGRRSGLDFENHSPNVLVAPRTLDERGMNRDSQPGVCRPRGKKISDRVAGNGEGQTARDHGVDADDLAARVGQWSAGISRREAYVRRHPGLPSQATKRAHGVNYSGCQRANKTHWIANGDGKFARDT